MTPVAHVLGWGRTRWWLVAAVVLAGLAALGGLHWVTSEPAPPREGGFALRTDGTRLDLGGDEVFPFDVNEKDEVVGQARFGDTGFRAFLLREGELLDLGTLGGYRSRATAINDKGQVVGEADSTPSGGSQAFLWEGGRMTDLNPPEAWRSEAVDINAQGTIIGTAIYESGARGVIWEEGRPRFLQGLKVSEGEGGGALPLKINDSGQIVDRSGGRAVMWDGDRLVDLAPGIPIDINERGQVLIRQQADGPRTEYVVWQKGKLTPLPAVKTTGNLYWYAFNNHGDVAGGLSEGDRTRACLIRKGALDMPAAGGDDSVAFAINDRGTVIGHTSGD